MRALVLALTLTGCGSTVIQDRPVSVKVPVAQSCVNGTRPVRVTPINQQMTEEQWAALDVRQKSAWVGKQGLALRTYGEGIAAVTGGCK